MDRPDWSSLHTMVDDLKQAIGSLGETQQRIMRITGTGWSPDHLVKVTVGPRGQLVDLEIDPRVFRYPDSHTLAETILTASRVAIENANAQSVPIVDSVVPADLRRGPFGGDESLTALIKRHDADIAAEGGPRE
jgi:DNA-binding protein YbaB